MVPIYIERGEDIAVRERRPIGQTCREEGAPPPAVVLSTKVEIAEQNGGLGTHDQQHNKGQQEKPKHVVHLSPPG